MEHVDCVRRGIVSSADRQDFIPPEEVNSVFLADRWFEVRLRNALSNNRGISDSDIGLCFLIAVILY